MDKKEILLLQEAERKRIAEELHDTTVQDMVCLSQQLELILLYMDEDVTLARLQTAVARRQVKRMIGDMRETIYNLRPMMINDVGWQASFERLKEKLFSANPELKVRFDIDAVGISDGITAISIYRIVCEGCRNIIRHSGADSIEVSVKKVESFIKIRIWDNGIGIGHGKEEAADKNHFGIQFMRERVDALSGKMKIVSDSSGTLIEIEIPTGRGRNR